jgi:hypothetical protein
MIQKFFFSALLFLLVQAAGAQTAALLGTVTAADNNAPVADASVVLAQTGRFAATDNRGKFALDDLPAGEYTLTVSSAGFLPHEQRAVVRAGEALEVTVSLKRDPNAVSGGNATDIPTITLEEAEEESEGLGEIANLLHASRDVFQNASSFGWSVFRFRERGSGFSQRDQH